MSDNLENDCLKMAGIPVSAPLKLKELVLLDEKHGRDNVNAALWSLVDRGLVEFAVSVRCSWLTDKGREARRRMVAEQMAK